MPASQTEDFFRGRLDQMIDLRHPLAVLSTHMPWQEIEASLAGLIARKVKAGRKVEDIDLFELNEAFAAVSIASTKALNISPEIVNVNGGAIALGHPVGMSGARLALHAALEQKRRGGGIVAVALCGGGGQGSALLLRV